jgi:hypothetical protein
MVSARALMGGLLLPDCSQCGASPPLRVLDDWPTRWVLHDGQDVLARRDVEPWLDPPFAPVNESKVGLDRRWIAKTVPSAHAGSSMARRPRVEQRFYYAERDSDPTSQHLNNRPWLSWGST